jgi:hypothetical protein
MTAPKTEETTPVTDAPAKGEGTAEGAEAPASEEEEEGDDGE